MNNSLKSHNKLILKSRNNYSSYFRKIEKSYSANILKNDFYFVELYLMKDKKYRLYMARKYDILENKLGVYRNRQFFETINSIDTEERVNFQNLKKNIDEIINEEGDMYRQFLNNTSICFSRELKEKPQNLYLLIDNTNNNLVFTFNMDELYMIFNLCKTENPLYKDLRMSDLFRAFLSNTRYIHYVHLDFNEPNYDKVVALFIRCGFSLKGPTSLPNEFILDEYTKNKRYLLMSFNPYKSINYNSLNTANLLAISNNIREYETKLKVEHYQLDYSSIKNILKYVCSWDHEISGSFTQVSDKLEINLLENLSKNTNLNNGSELLVKPDIINDTHCTVNLETFDIMNYHTHPVYCYIKNKSNYSKLGPPSRPDIYLFTDALVNAYVSSTFKCHLVITLECIYVIQIHPYWINKLKNKSEIFTEDFYGYLSFLIEYYSKNDIINLAYSNPKKILELLYFLNNKFNFNELSKDTPHTFNAPRSEENTRKEYKNRYFANDLDRNMNLLLFSVIPYNWREDSEISKLHFTDIPTHLFNFLKDNSNDISKLTQYVLDNLNELPLDGSRFRKAETENIKIPYYYL